MQSPLASVISNSFILNVSKVQEITQTMNQDKDINRGYPALLSFLSDAIQQGNIKIVVGQIFDKKNQPVSGKAQYNPVDNTITMDSQFVATEDTNELARVLVHEIIHGLTMKTIAAYFPTGVYVPGMDLTGAPPHIVRLANLFNETRKLIGEERLLAIKLSIAQGLY